jgi:hypothetical protein
MYHPAYTRALLAAATDGYRVAFDSAEQANAFVRMVQKFAASVRRDPAAPGELRTAARLGEGGIMWRLPVLEDAGKWAVASAFRGRPTITQHDIGERLP